MRPQQRYSEREMKALDPLATRPQQRYSEREMKAIDPLATRPQQRYSEREMIALDPLAVADRDILALRTARENKARSGDSASAASASRPFSPPGTATAPHRTAPQPPRDRAADASHLPSLLRSSLRSGAHPSHDSARS